MTTYQITLDVQVAPADIGSTVAAMLAALEELGVIVDSPVSATLKEEQA